MKILHVITSLNDGGAEASLYRLIKKTQGPVDNYVISLRSPGKYSEQLQEIGVQTFHLNISQLFQVPKQIFFLYSLIKKIDPDVIQTWLYHADFIGGIVGKIAKKKVFWGIHNTTLEFGKSSFATIILVRILTCLSYFIPEKIISCSNSSTLYHVNLGYCKQKFLTIHNGIDIKTFHRSTHLRNLFRAELGLLNNSDLCIGTVARNDPQKDYPNLISALRLLQDQQISFKCVIAGPNTEQLLQLVQTQGLEHKIIILGPRNDIPKLMNGLDLFVLPSAYGEACPNVLLEAMACGVPCVSTNLGDCKYIIGETGKVVEPHNCQQLSQAILSQISHLSMERSECCLNRVSKYFTLDKMATSYQNAWQEILSR